MALRLVCGAQTQTCGVHALTAQLAPAGPALRLSQLDLGEAMRVRWPQLKDTLGPALAGLAIDEQAAVAMAVIPGVREALWLMELAALAEIGADAAFPGPVAEVGSVRTLLDLLELPEAITRWVRLALPVQQRVVRAISIGAHAPEGAQPRDAVAEALDALSQSLTQARATLVAHSMVVTTGLEPHEAAALSIHGLQVLPEPSAVADHPVGSGQPQITATQGGAYRWSLPLAGLVDHDGVGSLSLARHGDDLLLDLASTRRVITLPSALRRCRAGAAQVSAEELSIVFEPDPDLWPSP